jgi:aspartate/methionine/tyrosine aminotransferase
MPMSYQGNPQISSVVEPPIGEAQAWIAGRSFPPERPLIDLAQAVPSYPPAEALTAHLAGLVGRPATALYTAIRGLPALREALAGRTAERYGGDIGTERCFITAGCNQAFCLALMALAGPGDEVILPLPYYFNHQMWLEMQGVTVAHLPFRADRAGVPDPEEARALIRPRTRAIVLVTPNNPTGAVYPPEVIRAFYELAREHGLALILDETYRDFLPPEAPPHDLFRDPGWPGTLVHLYSFSKVYSLTGYRVGAIVAGEALLDQVAKIMDCVSICAPHIGQEAALYGLRALDAWVAEKRALIAARQKAFLGLFQGTAHGFELISAGAYFAYVRHPFAGEPGMTVARRLADQQNILCLPGSMFGTGQEACLRFAYANVDEGAIPAIGKRLTAAAPGPSSSAA